MLSLLTGCEAQNILNEDLYNCEHAAININANWLNGESAIYIMAGDASPEVTHGGWVFLRGSQPGLSAAFGRGVVLPVLLLPWGRGPRWCHPTFAALGTAAPVVCSEALKPQPLQQDARRGGHFSV